MIKSKVIEKRLGSHHRDHSVVTNIRKLKMMFSYSNVKESDFVHNQKNEVLDFYGMETDEGLTNTSLFDDMPKESYVGKQLTGRTVKKLVCIVLILLLVLPSFTASFWTNENLMGTYEIQLFALLLQQSLDSTGSIDQWQNSLGPRTLQFNVKVSQGNGGELVYYKDPILNYESS